MQFTRHDDGSVTVDQFDEQAEWTPELLGQDSARLQVTITVKADNGEAVYLVTGFNQQTGNLQTKLLAQTKVA